jgi:dihydrofolate reductase
MIRAIVAMDEARAIGRAGGIPWYLPEDLKRFARLTRGHTVVMGRKTYESLPEKSRPLPGRRNIVISRSENLRLPLGVDQLPSVEALEHICKKDPSGEYWIIGGGDIYRQTLPLWDEVYLTVVPGQHGGDTFLLPFEHDFLCSEEVPGEACTFKTYQRSS